MENEVQSQVELAGKGIVAMDESRTNFPQLHLY